MYNTKGGRFILTTKIYMNPNDTTILRYDKKSIKGKSYVDPEGMAINNL